MDHFDGAFAARLGKKLANDIEVRVNGISSGAAPSFENYREQCGYLRALREVMEDMKAIEAELKQGK